MTPEQIIGLLVVAAIVAISLYRSRKRTSVAITTPAPSPASRRTAPNATTATPAAIRSWGYQLQHLDLSRAAESPFDLLVIDPSRDGSDEGTLTAAEVARLKVKPDGTRRLVVAYLSIGEAESYRGYWQASWKKQKPAWLLAENPEWKENYAVCYWDPGWQSIMCGAPRLASTASSPPASMAFISTSATSTRTCATAACPRPRPAPASKPT